MSRSFLLTLSFWLVLGFVSWNVLFDRRVAAAALAYTRAQTVNHQHGLRTVSIDEGFRPRVREAAAGATLWASAIAGIGAIVSLRAHRHSRRPHTPPSR